jgi:hypothetical protein
LTPSEGEEAAGPNASDDSPAIATDAEGSDRVASPALPRSAAASEPSDADIERGILDALARGLDGVAKSLAGQLDERRRARVPANVESIEEARAKRERQR